MTEQLDVFGNTTPATQPAEASERFTESELLSRLRTRYTNANGNGPRWAFIPHVRDRAGFDATRTLDAVVLDTWPSSGLALHGFEVKCSRSDWRRELASPEKAAAFTRWMDYFWVVAPRGIVDQKELPGGWGLIETRRNGLVAAVKAQRNSQREDVDRSFLAALLRAACHRGGSIA